MAMGEPPEISRYGAEITRRLIRAAKSARNASVDDNDTEYIALPERVVARMLSAISGNINITGA